MSDPGEHELYRGAHVSYSILDETGSTVFPRVTPPPGPFRFTDIDIPGQPGITDWLDLEIRRRTQQAIPDAFRRKPVIEPWVWDRTFPTRDLKPFIEEQQRLVKLIAERHCIPLRLLDDSTPVPTPKPRRANPESDTMTDTPTTEAPEREPGALSEDQANRSATLITARSVLANNGGVMGAISGGQLPERFGVEALLDVSEYVRSGVVTSRFGTAHSTVIDRFDPAEPSEEVVAEHIKTRAAYQKLADTITARRVLVPFENAAGVFVDMDAPDAEFKAAVKEARAALKQLVTDRGL